VVTGGGVQSKHLNPKLYRLRVGTTDHPLSARYGLCCSLVEGEKNVPIFFSYFRACNFASPSQNCIVILYMQERSYVLK
jgi:hypothetical protein